MRGFIRLKSAIRLAPGVALSVGAAIWLSATSLSPAFDAPATVILAPLVNLGPIVVPANPIPAPVPRAMLIPNWEVGRSAAVLLPNYTEGMGKIVLVDQRADTCPAVAPLAD